MLALGGCGNSKAEPGAHAFLPAHEAEAAKAAAAVRLLAEDARSLELDATQARLESLTTDAAHARRELIRTSEWPVTAAREEEDLEQAQVEVVEASKQLIAAAAAVRAYARVRDPATLARWRSELHEARERWNAGISQLWYLDGRHGAPTI